MTILESILTKIIFKHINPLAINCYSDLPRRFKKKYLILSIKFENDI